MMEPRRTIDDYTCSVRGFAASRGSVAPQPLQCRKRPLGLLLTGSLVVLRPRRLAVFVPRHRRQRENRFVLDQRIEVEARATHEHVVVVVLRIDRESTR